MDATLPARQLPEAIHQALTATGVGATGVARLAIAGLRELADDPAAVREVAALLRDSLPGYAPIWHIAEAASAADPVGALARMRAELDEAVDRSVAAATSWVTHYGGPALAAPSSSLVAQVLARLGLPGDSAGAVVGLCGADAISPTMILNIKGTRAVAERVPTLVVTTSLKLVPESVFATLGAPTFETIPLQAFTGVVLDGELLSPVEAGWRAASAARGRQFDQTSV